MHSEVIFLVVNYPVHSNRKELLMQDFVYRRCLRVPVRKADEWTGESYWDWQGTGEFEIGYIVDGLEHESREAAFLYLFAEIGFSEAEANQHLDDLEVRDWSPRNLLYDEALAMGLL